MTDPPRASMPPSAPEGASAQPAANPGAAAPSVPSAGDEAPASAAELDPPGGAPDPAPTALAAPSAAIAVQDGEAEVLGVLAGLASMDSGEVAAAVSAAQASRHLVYDHPLRRLAAGPAGAPVRAAALTALGELIWPPEPDELAGRLDTLAHGCFDDDPVVRAAAVGALGLFPTPEARRILQMRLGAAPEEEAATVRAALARMATPESVQRLATWVAGGAVSEPMPPHGIPGTWRLARAARYLLASPTAEDVAGAVDVLLDATEPGSVRAVLLFGARSAPQPVRIQILEALAAKPSPADVTTLLALLADAAPALRSPAAVACARHPPGDTIAAALLDRFAVDPSPAVLRELAAALRIQDVASLARGLEPVVRQSDGYRLRLAVFLLRELRGREVLWAQVLAQAHAPSPEAVAALREVDAPTRLEVGLPRLAPASVAELTIPERETLLAMLEDIDDSRLGEALLALVDPGASAPLLAAMRPAVRRQSDPRLTAHLKALLAAPELAGRRAVYQMLLERPAIDVGTELAAALAREDDTELRAFLLEQCAGHREPEVIAAVAAQLADRSTPRLAGAALDLLEGVGDPLLADRFADVFTAEGGSGNGEQAYELLLALPSPVPITHLRAFAASAMAPAPERSGELDDLTRARIVRDLGQLGDGSDIPILRAASDDEAEPVREAAREALHAIDPDAFPLSDEWGRYPLVAAAGAASGTLFWLTTRAAGGAALDRELLLGVGGAIVGGTTAFLLTLPPRQDVSLGEAGYFTTLGVWSALGGYSLSRVSGLAEGTAPSADLWMALGFEAAGIAVAGATMKLSRFSLADVAFTNLFAASWGMGLIGGARLARLDRTEGSGSPADVFVIGALAGAIPMLVLSPEIELDANALGGIGVTSAVGAWLGGFAPYAIADDADGLDVVAGVAFGQAMGLTGGLVLDALLESSGRDFDFEVAAWGGSGLLLGAAAGAGLGLSEPGLRGRPTFALLEGVGIASGGVLAWLGPSLEIAGTDAALIGTLAAAGALGGARLPARALHAAEVSGVPESTSDEALWGGLLLGTTAGAYAGLAVSQLVDSSPGELAIAATGGTLVGLGAGGLAFMLPGADAKLFSPLFSAGLATGTLGLTFLAPYMDYAPPDVALGASTAVLGAALGAMTPLYWSGPDGSPVADPQQLGGGLVGAAAGAVAAGVVSQLTEISWGRTLKIDLTALAGLGVGAGVGLVVPDFDARATVALMQAGAVAGYAAALWSERSTTYELDRGLHLALGGAVGAGVGWSIPFLWREGDERAVPADEIIGGVLVGTGAGALSARLMVGNATRELDDVSEIAVVSALAAAAGGGAGLFLGDDVDRRLRAGLFVGASAAGFGLAEWLAPATEYTFEDVLLAGALGSAGALGGLGLAWAILDGEGAGEGESGDPSGESMGGGALWGAGLASLAGMAVTQVRPAELDDIGELYVFSSVGALAGLGTAAPARGAEDRDLVVGADAGWLAGMALSAAVAPYTEYTDADLAFIAAGAGLGAWIGGLGVYAAQGDGGAAGAVPAGGAAGSAYAFAASAAAAQLFDLDPWITFEGSLTAGAGALFTGGLTLMGLVDDPGAAAATMMIGGAGGMALGLGLGHVTTISDDDWGLWGTVTGLGAWLGAWTPAAVDVEPDEATYSGGLLAGAGAAGLVGYGLTQLVDVDGWTDLELASSTAVGALAGGGASLMLASDPGWQARGILLGSAAGLAIGAGVASLTDYEEATPLLVAAGAWGAWHGAWLGAALRTADEGQRLGGGALLGLGVGLGAGMAVSQLGTYAWDEVGEASSWMAVGNLFGAGVGLLALADDPAVVGLMEGAGIAAVAGGLLAAEYTEYTAEDYALMAYTTAVGAGQGALLRGLFEDGDGRDMNDRGVGGGALVGAGVGLAGGMLLGQWLEVDPIDVVEMTLWTGLGDALGLGVALLADVEGPGFYGILQAGGLGLTAAGIATATLTDFSGPDRLLTTGGAAAGAWLGAWTPLLWQPDGVYRDGVDVAAGMLTGLAVGTLGAGVASQLLGDLDYGDVGELTLGTSLSAAFGAGLGLVVSEDDRAMVGAMDAAALTGAALIGAFAPQTEISAGDAGLGAIAGLYGVYQGAGLTLLADGSARQVGGGIVLGAAAGSLLGMYLGPYVQLDAVDVLMLAAGSAWGVWLGIWTTAAIDEASGGQDDVIGLGFGTTALLTDVALVATSVAISELVDLEPLRFAWISIFGGGGLLLGVTTSLLATDTYAQGLLWGTAGGLALGTVLTAFVDLPGMGAPPEPAPVSDQASPSAAGALLPDVETWLPSVQVSPTPDEQGQQVLFTVTGLF